MFAAAPPEKSVHSVPEKSTCSAEWVLFCTVILPLPEVERDITLRCGTVWYGVVPVYIRHILRNVPENCTI